MGHGNHQPGFLNRYRVVSKLFTTIVLLIIFQISLFGVGNDVDYWKWHHTSTDFIELTFSVALFISISYVRIKHKMLSACLVIWFFYGAISQLFTDYLFQNFSNNTAFSIFATVFLSIIFLSRFVLRWRNRSVPLDPDYFYEVIGKPTNIKQLIVAVYSGHGGSFAITDGVHIWYYSKQQNCMVCEVLDPTYIVGRMVKKICNTSHHKYDKLNRMTGPETTFMNNCLKLHALSSMWR